MNSIFSDAVHFFSSGDPSFDQLGMKIHVSPYTDPVGTVPVMA